MPRINQSIVCLPDTNSLIHLRGINVLNKSACLWLWDEFDVRISDEIPVELQNNVNRNPDLEVREIARKVPSSTITLSVNFDLTEECFFKPLGIEFNHNRDMGERKNTLLAFQSIAQNRTRQVIFLTNERRAVESATGFIRKTFDAYPLGVIWNAMDFLLYLYLRHRRFLLENAQDALRDVNTRMLGTTDAMTERLRLYNNRLDIFDTARRRIPNLWV